MIFYTLLSIIANFFKNPSSVQEFERNFSHKDEGCLVVATLCLAMGTDTFASNDVG